MTKNKTEEKNGTTPVVPLKKDGAVMPTPPSASDAKPPLSNIQIGEKGKVVLSINQRLEKLDELNAITERYNQMVTQKEKLQRFKLSSDKNLDKLVIADGYGNKFETSNSAALKEVHGVLLSMLETKIAETEMQIVF